MSDKPDARHLAALRTHWKRHKAFPSMSKLAGTLNLASSGSVFAAVGRLTEAGFLERVEGRIAPTSKFFAYPLLGRVRAGHPQPASQDQFETLNAEDVLVRDPNRTSYCHVRGDSMIDAGLLDGDIVALEANSLPKAGDIVVAVVDGQTTVKYLKVDPLDGGWVLEPANPEYAPIRPTDSLEVLGVVVGSFRTYRR